MNIEVTTVSKTREKLSRTAAAVFVITQEDIRRSGANSLPEVLRMAPGVHAARVVGTTWAVGIRGFNNLYSNKLLVMVDGRTIYNALFSGVLWHENLVLLEEIERIEVIRGPGATMWGANAVTGVINIITKNAKNTKGGRAAVSGGNFNAVKARVQYGGSAGPNAAWRTWGQYSLQGNAYFPVLGRSLDPWPAERGGIRMDWEPSDHDTLQVEAEGHHNTSTTPGITAGFDGPESGGTISGGGASGYALGRWQHTTRRGDQMTVQMYNHEDSIDAGPFTAWLRTLDFDIQHTVRINARHESIFGGGFRSSRVDTTGTPEFSFDPAGQTYQIANVFAHHEWEVVRDKLVISGGAKLEHYTIVGAKVQPTASAIWTPTRKQAYWASLSRAVRTPAHTDYALRLPTQLPGIPAVFFLMGTQQFKPETLKAFEAGSRFQFRQRLALDIAVYRHWYSGVAAYSLLLPAGGRVPLSRKNATFVLPVTTVNGVDGTNQGGEVTLSYDIRPGWRINGVINVLQTNMKYRPEFNAAGSFTLGNYTPAQHWQVRSSWDFAKGWESDVTFYECGELPDGALPRYSQLDARIGRKLGEFTEVSVSGRNLLRPYQQEFAGNVLYPAGLVRRSIEAGVRWRF